MLSISDVKKLIGQRVSETPDGEWVLAKSNWHEGILKEGELPTKYDLDPVSPKNPVYIPRGGHVTAVNSLALEIAGITKDTKDPEGGVIVKDPETGEPTGLLLGQPATALVKEFLPKNSSDKLKPLIEMMETANSFGVTTITDPSVEGDAISTYLDAWKSNKMTVRVNLLHRVRTLDDVKYATSVYKQGFGDNFLKFSGLKYYADGGVENAYLKDPYQIVEGEQEDTNYHGTFRLPPGGQEELEKMFKLAAEEGWSVGTHAVGDASIERIVNLYEKVNKQTSIKDLRWAVLHIFLPTEENISKMKDLGVLTTVQGHPVLLGHNMKRYWGDERASYSIPIRDLIDSGLVVGGGTDAPVNPTSPFISLWWMVTRGTYTAGVLGPEQAITREEALRLFTMDSAITQFNEDIIGSIEPGKLADMAVLSDNYFSVPEEQIKDITSIMTIVNGKIVYKDPNKDNEIQTFSSLRQILEESGAKVRWDDASNSIIATNGKNQLTFQIGSSVGKVNDAKIQLDAKLKIINGITLVPIRSVEKIIKYL